MLKGATVTLTAGLIVYFLVSPAAASCIYDERTIDQQIAGSDVVFVGTVTELTNQNREATFHVEEVWKGGPLPEKVKVLGGPSDTNAMTSVDRTFQPSTRYLVFPFGEAPDFNDNSCSPTRLWSEDLRAHRPSDAAPPTKDVSPRSGAAGSDLGSTDADDLDASTADGEIERDVPTVLSSDKAEGSSFLTGWAWAGVIVGAFTLTGSMMALLRKIIAKR